MSAAHVSTACCTGETCAAHHDRLLTVDVDPDALLALLEIAVTWHELDYSTTDVLGPTAWLTFAQTHTWTHADRAARAFSVAVDIVGRAAAGPPPAVAV